MGRIKLFVANANETFTKSEVDILHSAAEKAESFISTNFTFDYEVDLIITSPSFLMPTIPEDGISGRTYNSRLIILVIDKYQKKINEDIVFETICHEMSHSLRWEKLPEYSRTLFDGMILEGLAIVLEEAALEEQKSKAQQFFLKEIQSTDQKTIDSIITHLKDTMNNEQYDYDTIFYTGNAVLPRWSGYRLGYYYVRKHLRDRGMTIFQATLESYSIFSS